MEHDTLLAIRCIRYVAQRAAEVGGLSVPVIERFLRTGEETWDGAGCGRFTLAQIKQDGIYTEPAKAALRNLFDLLAGLLPPEAKTVPPVAPKTIRRRVDPMVMGLVQTDWQEIAVRELTFWAFQTSVRPGCHEFPTSRDLPGGRWTVPRNTSRSKPESTPTI